MFSRPYWILLRVEDSFIVRENCLDYSNRLWNLTELTHFANLPLQSNSGLVSILYKTVAVPAKLILAFYSRSKMGDK